MSLSDRDFLKKFESLTLPEEYFSHRGHLRLAWLYLRRYPLDEAIEKMACGIQAYATSLGATNKFHRTLTEAMARIINARLQRSRADTFDGFINANLDLVTDAPALIRAHYSKNLINSESARRVFVQPDLQAF